jgi:hypothetical protein
MLISKYFHFISNNPLSRFPQRRAERLKIALQAILAKAPDCRIVHRSSWPLPKISQRANFLTVGSPVGEGWEGGKNYLSNYCFIHDCRYSYNIIMRTFFEIRSDLFSPFLKLTRKKECWQLSTCEIINTAKNMELFKN